MPHPYNVTQVNTEDLFLKNSNRKQLSPSLTDELNEILYDILDRAEIGRNAALLDDEVDNFNWIVQLVHKALRRLA